MTGASNGMVNAASASFGGANATSSILATITGINGLVIANTPLFTVPAGFTCVVTGYVVKVTAANSVSNGPSAGIGNIAGTNNISTSQTMTTLTTTASNFEWPIVGASLSTAAAGIIYYNQGTGATATAETLMVDLLGYLY